MGELIEINQKRIFALDEANELLPIVRRITQSVCEDVKRFNVQLTLMKDREKAKGIEDNIQAAFNDWQKKIRKLGCEAKGMWLVDFDNGEGYYCWHYPETTIDYFHGYFDGYQGRMKVT